MSVRAAILSAQRAIRMMKSDRSRSSINIGLALTVLMAVEADGSLCVMWPALQLAALTSRGGISCFQRFGASSVPHSVDVMGITEAWAGPVVGDGWLSRVGLLTS